MLGICIPYYKNSRICEENFKELMISIKNQLSDDMILVIYEDGQKSLWLDDYKCKNIDVIQDLYNMGVSHARNTCIDYLLHIGVDYILFIDSDDMIECNYLETMADACMTYKYDLVDSIFFVNNKLYDPAKKTSVSGCAIKSELIKNMRFNEKLQIGEDTDYINRLYDKKSDLKVYKANTSYFYNLGSNLNSLMMRYKRGEINKWR